jgi:hypothetical protein
MAGKPSTMDKGARLMQPARKLGGIAAAAAITMVAIVIAACSDSGQGPLSPSVAQRDLSQMTDRSAAGGCLSATTVVKDIGALYPSGGPMYLAGKAAVLYAAELVAVGPIKGVKPDTALGQQIALQLVDTTLKLFTAGKLIGGTGASTAQLAVTVLDAVLCSAGLPQTLTTASLGSGSTGAAQVIQPNAPTTTVITGDQNAGVQVPQGNLKVMTLVTITPITGPNCVPYSGPLCTPLAQFPPYYQYTFTPSVDATQTPNLFTFEVCATTTNINVPLSDLFLAHNVTNPANGITTAQVLPTAAGNLGLECDAQIGMRPASGASVFELARRGDVRGAVESLASAAEGLFVTDAFASGGTKTSITGTAHSASPFGLVDVNDIIPYQNGQWSYHAPLPPGGTFATPPAPFTGDIAGYGLNPAFVPAGSPGWVVSASPFGTAPFGSGTSVDGNAFGCALSSLPNLNLVWPTFLPPASTGNLNLDPSSIFLLQATFFVPTDWTSDIVIGVAIDNDIQIFLNGTDITNQGTVAAGSSAYYDTSQFLIHEGCATQDSYVITLHVSSFHTGNSPNVLAVRARDRGDEDYVDLRVSPAAPFVPPFISP